MRENRLYGSVGGWGLNRPPPTQSIARTAAQENRSSAPSMAFNQPGESPGLGNVTAQYPKVVTA